MRFFWNRYTHTSSRPHFAFARFSTRCFDVVRRSKHGATRLTASMPHTMLANLPVPMRIPSHGRLAVSSAQELIRDACVRGAEIGLVNAAGLRPVNRDGPKFV